MPIKKNVNKDFFRKWTPQMAYVLGFFFADGSHDVNPRGSEYFSFQITDKVLLQRIQRALGSNHKIATRRPRTPNENAQYRLQIGSKDMCADLRAHGILSNKASTMRLPKIPHNLFSHFVRGYFDGDGNVWVGDIHKKRKTRHVVLQAGFTSCSKYFLGQLKRELKHRGMLGGSLYCKKNAFCLKYSTSDSLALYEFMYPQMRGSGLFLSRKKKIFEKYIQLWW